MGSSVNNRLVTVDGEGYKYTNPGGFVVCGNEEYVIARRNDLTDDMASPDASRSSIVLLKRTGFWHLVDTGLVLLKGGNGLGYEDPRLLPFDIYPGSKGFTYTYVRGKSYCSWVRELSSKNKSNYNKMMGPPVSPSKNGFIFQSENGRAIVVSRPDGKPIKFYQLKDIKQAMASFAMEKPVSWWDERLLAEIELPSWARGEQGGFEHIGFGTIINPRAAIIHFGKSTESGKYYVTALQRLMEDGRPDGPPEIIAEPAKGLPVGDVPNVIYTVMAWVEGKELVLWSGHDDTYIIETRMRSPLS